MKAFTTGKAQLSKETFCCYRDFTTIIFHHVLHFGTLLYIKKSNVSHLSFSSRKWHLYQDQSPRVRLWTHCTGKHPGQHCWTHYRYSGATRVRLCTKRSASKNRLHSSKLNRNTSNTSEAQSFQRSFSPQSLLSHAYMQFKHTIVEFLPYFKASASWFCLGPSSAETVSADKIILVSRA